MVKIILLNIQNKIKFQFINLYLAIIKNIHQNDPSSMAIFDKKLRSIANTIKDNYIKKYVLEYFLEKISELTPHTSQNKKNFLYKKTKSLETTKKHFNESKSLTGVELKEFSLIYLVINNLNLIQENIHLVENIKLFTDVK